MCLIILILDVLFDGYGSIGLVSDGGLGFAEQCGAGGTSEGEQGGRSEDRVEGCFVWVLGLEVSPEVGDRVEGERR